MDLVLANTGVFVPDISQPFPTLNGKSQVNHVTLVSGPVGLNT